MRVTAQAVQLGDDIAAACQRSGELRPRRRRVVPLAGLDLGQFGRVTKPSYAETNYQKPSELANDMVKLKKVNVIVAVNRLGTIQVCEGSMATGRAS
jgi:hypothetical protein